MNDYSDNGCEASNLRLGHEWRVHFIANSTICIYDYNLLSWNLDILTEHSNYLPTHSEFRKIFIMSSSSSKILFICLLSMGSALALTWSKLKLQVLLTQKLLKRSSSVFNWKLASTISSSSSTNRSSSREIVYSPV